MNLLLWLVIDQDFFINIASKNRLIKDLSNYLGFTMFKLPLMVPSSCPLLFKEINEKKYHEED